MGVYVVNNRKFYNPYDAIMHEYMDICHDETRRYILEQKDPKEQTQVLGKLTSRLYGHITNKVTDIDFGSIPDSRGDITQIDLPDGKKSGLKSVINILKEVEDIGFMFFHTTDVVRHKLVQDIIKAYEKHEGNKKW